MKGIILAGGSGNTSGATSNNEVSQSDPLFKDAANDDYSITMSSDAIDAGSSGYAPATDINGTARPQGSSDDVGCYELAINSWQGGTAGSETVALKYTTTNTGTAATIDYQTTIIA